MWLLVCVLGWCFAAFRPFSLCDCFAFIVGAVGLDFGGWLDVVLNSWLRLDLRFWCGWVVFANLTAGCAYGCLIAAGVLLVGLFVFVLVLAWFSTCEFVGLRIGCLLFGFLTGVGWVGCLVWFMITLLLVLVV